MNPNQHHALSLRQTDVRGAILRLSGNEQIYASCLSAFLDDQTVNELNESIKRGAWDDAFTAAHALKGVAGNMGFMPLMHSASQLVVLIRGGRMLEVDEALEQVNSSYRDIVDGIHQFFEFDDKGHS